jgi:hypothetical protein
MPFPEENVDHDPFRTPGSRYEHDEPFVVALVPSGVVFEWRSSTPVRALWLPEDFFGVFYRTGRELRLPLTSTLTDLYSRYGFSRAELPQLATEFSEISRHLDPPLSEAARFVAGLLLEGVASSRPLDAIIEGP